MWNVNLNEKWMSHYLWNLKILLIIIFFVTGFPMGSMGLPSSDDATWNFVLWLLSNSDLGLNLASFLVFVVLYYISHAYLPGLLQSPFLGAQFPAPLIPQVCLSCFLTEHLWIDDQQQELVSFVPYTSTVFLHLKAVMQALHLFWWPSGFLLGWKQSYQIFGSKPT